MRSRSSGRAGSSSSATARCVPSSKAAPTSRSPAASRTTTCPRYIAESTVLCQPSLIEPFGQALLEGMASGRSVVATRVGGPPEFVPPEAGDPRRPARHGRARGRDAPRGRAPDPEPGRASSRGRARRQASGGEDRVDSGKSRSRSASLTSTSGRIRFLEPGLLARAQRLLRSSREPCRATRLASIGCRRSRGVSGSARAGRVGHRKKRSFGRLGVELVGWKPSNPPSQRPVRVLIADDERLFVESVHALLHNDDRVEVVGQPRATARTPSTSPCALVPDVTLMDISMPVLDGIEAARRIRLEHPDACILILTGSSIVGRRRPRPPGRSRRLPHEGPDRDAARRRDPRDRQPLAATLSPCCPCPRS